MRLEDVTLDDVDELGTIKIDRRKSSNERILDFLTKVKNPYVFKINGRLVRMRFLKMAQQQMNVWQICWKIYTDKKE